MAREAGVEIVIQYEAQLSTVWPVETRHECNYIPYSLKSILQQIYRLVGDSKAPGRSLSESTRLRSHAASVEIDRPIFALASGLKQFAKASCGSPGSSRAGELAKLWKCEGSAALTLLSVIQHSSVQKLFCMMNTAV